jgi:hypothetical protein
MRHAPLAKIHFEWIQVSPTRPCKVCGAQKGCRATDEEFACCASRPSEWPLTTGGWLHRIELKTQQDERAG